MNLSVDTTRLNVYIWIMKIELGDTVRTNNGHVGTVVDTVEYWDNTCDATILFVNGHKEYHNSENLERIASMKDISRLILQLTND
jgi:hypothetical protein